MEMEEKGCSQIIQSGNFIEGGSAFANNCPAPALFTKLRLQNTQARLDRATHAWNPCLDEVRRGHGASVQFSSVAAWKYHRKSHPTVYGHQHWQIDRVHLHLLSLLGPPCGWKYISFLLQEYCFPLWLILGTQVSSSRTPRELHFLPNPKAHPLLGSAFSPSLSFFSPFLIPSLFIDVLIIPITVNVREISQETAPTQGVDLLSIPR